MSTQAKGLHEPLRELEPLLEKYSPLMSGSTEKALGRVIEIGAIIAAVSSPRYGNQQDIDTF